MKLQKRFVVLSTALAVVSLVLFTRPAILLSPALAAENHRIVHIPTAAHFIPADTAPQTEIPALSAAAAILINADTGTVLGEKNPHQERAIASITKIMTALLTAEAGDLDTDFVVDSQAVLVEGTSMGLLPGDTVNRRALIFGMMLPSGNDAANAAAVSVAGSISAFVDRMNERAAAIGMENTHFANPHGLDQDGHYSSAYDMALLTRVALKNPLVARAAQTRSISVRYGNPPYTRWLTNNNKLLDMYPGVIGVKTGFTDNARRCLVSACERDGITLIAVTLNAADDWNDHIKMYDFGFAMVKNREVQFDPSEYSVEVAGGSVPSRAPVVAGRPMLLPLSEKEMQDVTFEVTLKPFIYAGYNQNEYAGEVTFYFKGQPFRTYALVTADAFDGEIQQPSWFDRLMNFLRRMF
jgi:D-alanyl-D-alanine carboxypeptidase/D-alanyl-D-alanine carboxypeptidase (penicillin-binding protein 5/6)